MPDAVNYWKMMRTGGTGCGTGADYVEPAADCAVGWKWGSFFSGGGADSRPDRGGIRPVCIGSGSGCRTGTCRRFCSDGNWSGGAAVHGLCGCSASCGCCGPDSDRGNLFSGKCMDESTAHPCVDSCPSLPGDWRNLCDAVFGASGQADALSDGSRADRGIRVAVPAGASAGSGPAGGGRTAVSGGWRWRWQIWRFRDSLRGGCC